MAGESRLSEQESGFNTAKTKGIRLSGLLTQAKAQQKRERGDEERIRVKTKVERMRDSLQEEGGGELGYE